MSTLTNIRTRFAPSPTGLMHLGNIRAALLNYLFARHSDGTFVLRIEDTDPKRNFDPQGKKIRADLQWLAIHYDEGPGVGGPYAPYIQSERTALYQEKLDALIDANKVYRCFCSPDELDRKRARQLALKQPPRYDRTCQALSEEILAAHMNENKPFIWRFKLNHNEAIVISDLARGKVIFELKHFSDIPLTRQDGTFTFMFANCIDDITMQITHVFRGEDHLSNTAGQAALYQAFDMPLPTFWHMPILCNIDGKKLSKRDFGFSLSDLRAAGYLPEAICNYLAIIGGGAFKNEIMSLDELASSLDLADSASSGQVKYDVEKLRWINQQWIQRLDTADLAARIRPFLETTYDLSTITPTELEQLATLLQKELYTLQESIGLGSFYFNRPTQSHITTKLATLPENACAILQESVPVLCEHISDAGAFNQALQRICKDHDIPIKYGYWFVRIMLTGQKQGPSVQDLLTVLGKEKITLRLCATHS